MDLPRPLAGGVVTRIAIDFTPALRQQAGMSQQAVADELGIAQQTLAHYEVGRLRMPVSLLPKLAELFGVPGDELLGLNAARAGKRGPAPKLQQQIERLHRLPKAKQKLVEARDGHARRRADAAPPLSLDRGLPP